jgi:hypothetical protein
LRSIQAYVNIQAKTEKLKQGGEEKTYQAKQPGFILPETTSVALRVSKKKCPGLWDK